jgi:hypothetical protein
MPTDPAAETDPDSGTTTGPAPVFHRDREDRMDHDDPRDREAETSGSSETSESSGQDREREGGPSSGTSGDWRQGTPE